MHGSCRCADSHDLLLFFLSDQQFSFAIGPFSHSCPRCPWTDHSDENALPFRFSHDELGSLSLVTAQARSTLELCWPLQHARHVPASVLLFLLFPLPGVVSLQLVFLPDAVGPSARPHPRTLKAEHRRRCPSESEGCGFLTAPLSFAV